MIIRLSHITAGSATVRAVIPAAPGAAFGWRLPLGTVRRHTDGRWLSLDTEQTLVGIAATRKAAVDRLANLAREEQNA